MADFYLAVLGVAGLGLASAYASRLASRGVDEHKDFFFYVQLVLMLLLGLQLFLEGLRPGVNSLVALALGSFLAYSSSKAIASSRHGRVVDRLERNAVLSLAVFEVPKGLALGAAFALSPEYGLTIASITAALNIPQSSLLALSLHGRSVLEVLKVSLSGFVFFALSAVLAQALLSGTPLTGAVLALCSGAVLWVAHQEYSGSRKK